VVAGPRSGLARSWSSKKTGRPVQFEITCDVRASLLAWLERRGGSVEDYVFPSRVDHTRHMSTRQYARLVDEWVTAVGLRPEEYGAHSLRRTKASMIYRATGTSARSRSCLVTPRSRTLCAISASTWRTRSSWQKELKSEIRAAIRSGMRMAALSRLFNLHPRPLWGGFVPDRF